MKRKAKAVPVECREGKSYILLIGKMEHGFVQHVCSQMVRVGLPAKKGKERNSVFDAQDQNLLLK